MVETSTERLMPIQHRFNAKIELVRSPPAAPNSSKLY